MISEVGKVGNLGLQSGIAQFQSDACNLCIPVAREHRSEHLLHALGAESRAGGDPYVALAANGRKVRASTVRQLLMNVRCR